VKKALQAVAARFLKVVAAGPIIEVYEFERMPNLNVRRSCGGQAEPEEQGKNDRRSRWNFIRTVNANFGNHDKFVTLTFAENVTDISQANREFKSFIKRLKYKCQTEIKYAVAIEFQKRGAVHYHMICNLPYVPKSEFAATWGNGFVKINRIKHVDNVGAYISKYMSKGMHGRDPRLRGRKMWFTSRNLERPIVLRGEEAERVLEFYGLDEKQKVFGYSYESEHHGLITYRQYNLNRV